MYILGINAYHADASACLLEDGRIVAAAAEERFNRCKHSAGFPEAAIRFCLAKAGIRADQIDHVAVSRDPSARLQQRVIDVALNVFPRNVTVKDRLASVGRLRPVEESLARALDIPVSELHARFHNVEHHRAHLASAFFASPFEEAALLSVDGFGDFVGAMTGHGKGTAIETLDTVEYPHSLGIFYTAVTQYLGFPHYGDESKVMGLASYGSPRYLKKFNDILRLLPSGRFELNLDYFTHHSYGVQMIWESGAPVMVDVWSAAFAEALGPARSSDQSIDQRHMDIAASLQASLENALEHICAELYHRTQSHSLGFAGGVALNCTFNGKIRERTPFEEVFIPPAAADDGTAVGAAYAVYHEMGGERRPPMRHPYTGPSFSEEEIRTAIERRNLCYTALDSVDAAARAAAHSIAGGAVVGWFQGGMEMGPRALGNRSILADPRRPEMREILNDRIKRRESFRPFAPSILNERVSDFFEHSLPSPFMSMAFHAKPDKRSMIPAALHVDGTARLQTVDREINPIFWKLIRAFEDETGVPVVLNTSFNENEPIVCTPDDALDCFIRTRMDFVFLDRFMITRESAPSEIDQEAATR